MISPKICHCIHPFFRKYAPVSTPSSYCIRYSVIKRYSVIVLYKMHNVQCANSTKYFQLSSLKGRACDSGVSVTFTIHSYQMCQLVSADNFFSFAEQESIFRNNLPLFSRQKLVDRKQTVQQSLPCDLMAVLGTGPMILVCKKVQITQNGHPLPTLLQIRCSLMLFGQIRCCT